jgi:prepilin-type N-terminal cleavage/methylation domain-containing protein
MKRLRTNNKTGFTLIEVMITMVVITIGVTGAMGFRYYCVLDAKKADVQITAARIATLLLEDWKGTGGVAIGSLAYNPMVALPESTGLTIDNQGVVGPDAHFTKLNSYHVVTNISASSIIHYYVTLSSAATLPMTLNVSVGWRSDYKTGALSAADKANRVMSFATYCD